MGRPAKQYKNSHSPTEIQSKRETCHSTLAPNCSPKHGKEKKQANPRAHIQPSKSRPVSRPCCRFAPLRTCRLRLRPPLRPHRRSTHSCAPPLTPPPSLPNLARPVSRASSSLPSRSHTLPNSLTEHQAAGHCSVDTPPTLLLAPRYPCRWWAQAGRRRRRSTVLLVT